MEHEIEVSVEKLVNLKVDKLFKEKIFEICEQISASMDDAESITKVFYKSVYYEKESFSNQDFLNIISNILSKMVKMKNDFKIINYILKSNQIYIQANQKPRTQNSNKEY